MLRRRKILTKDVIAAVEQDYLSGLTRQRIISKHKITKHNYEKVVSPLDKQKQQQCSFFPIWNKGQVG